MTTTYAQRLKLYLESRRDAFALVLDSGLITNTDKERYLRNRMAELEDILETLEEME